MEVKEPDLGYTGYSYADYLTWKFEEQVELIRGRIFKMSPAPKRIHQKLSHLVCLKLGMYLQNKGCEIYPAPFDVRLPLKSNRNEDIQTVVQPDICVICDKEKLDEAGCLGAPDIVIEILSKGNSKKELKFKYEVYEESGVKEYWIIQPDFENMMIYHLVNGKFQPSRLYTRGDQITSEILPGFVLDLEEVFNQLEE